MNVENLIKELEKLPKDAKVLVQSGPDGLDEVIATKLLRVTSKSDFSRAHYQADLTGPLDAVYLLQAEPDDAEFDCE